MTLAKSEYSFAADPKRHKYRTQVLSRQIQVLRVIALTKSFNESLGPFTPTGVERILYGKKDLPHLLDRQLKLQVGIGNKSLNKYESITPGVRERVARTLFDLLSEKGVWTLTRARNCLMKLPAPVPAALFYLPTSRDGSLTQRRHTGLIDIQKLGQQLSKEDHIALLVGLFREQQAIGDAQGCLELQWAIEDTFESRGFSYSRHEDILLDFALENSILSIALDDAVLMRNIKNISARLKLFTARSPRAGQQLRSTAESLLTTANKL